MAETLDQRRYFTCQTHSVESKQIYLLQAERINTIRRYPVLLITYA